MGWRVEEACLCLKDLVEELEDELSGDYLSCCRALCTRPAYYDALCIRKAVKVAVVLMVMWL